MKKAANWGIKRVKNQEDPGSKIKDPYSDYSSLLDILIDLFYSYSGIAGSRSKFEQFEIYLLHITGPKMQMHGTYIRW